MKKGITIRADSEISRQHTIDLTGINPKLPPSCLNKPTQCLTGSFGSTHEDRSALVVMINRNGYRVTGPTEMQVAGKMHISAVIVSRNVIMYISIFLVSIYCIGCIFIVRSNARART